MDILNERPADMSFEDYKEFLKLQKAWIKEHKQGQLYYLASEMVYSPLDIYKQYGIKRTYSPFVGKAKTDLLEPI